MDIGALSIAMSQSKIQQEIGVAIVKMAMNTGTESAEQLTEVMNKSLADPNIGNNIDVSI